jgi:hypothetical protein
LGGVVEPAGGEEKTGAAFFFFKAEGDWVCRFGFQVGEFGDFAGEVVAYAPCEFPEPPTRRRSVKDLLCEVLSSLYILRYSLVCFSRYFFPVFLH